MAEADKPPDGTPIARATRYPAVLVAGYLALQLLLLAWSAFPGQTMRGPQPLECWTFLAGGQALFVSWVWPTCRLAGRTGQRVAGRQVALETLLLLAASVPPALAAGLWVDATFGQVVAPAAYVAGWLLAGAVAVACPAGVRWAYSLLAGLANLALLGLGYVWLDFLRADLAASQAMWRFSPMCQASRLAESGLLLLPWPPRLSAASPDWLASLVPMIVLLVLLVVRLLSPKFDGRTQEVTDAPKSP